MTFSLRKASDWHYNETITVNSLEELKALEMDKNEILIVNFFDMVITIYDDYLE